MTQAARYDIHIHQGESWSEDFQFLDENDEPEPLSGYSADMEVRDTHGGALLMKLGSGSSVGGITIDTATATITPSRTGLQTAALQFRQGVYDLKLTASDGVVSYPMAGNVFVEPRVTE